MTFYRKPGLSAVISAVMGDMISQGKKNVS